MFDMELDRAKAAAFVTAHGWDAFLAMLGDVALVRTPSGQDRELYQVSTDWLRRRYITTLKARGARGDLFVKLV